MSPDPSIYQDEPNHAAIAVTDNGRTLNIRFINFDGGAPVSVAIDVHKTSGVAALRAAITELFTNEDVYAALLEQHLGKIAENPPPPPKAPDENSGLKRKITARHERKR